MTSRLPGGLVGDDTLLTVPGVLYASNLIRSKSATLETIAPTTCGAGVFAWVATGTADIDGRGGEATDAAREEGWQAARCDHVLPAAALSLHSVTESNGGNGGGEGGSFALSGVDFRWPRAAPLFVYASLFTKLAMKAHTHRGRDGRVDRKNRQRARPASTLGSSFWGSACAAL